MAILSLTLSLIKRHDSKCLQCIKTHITPSARCLHYQMFWTIQRRVAETKISSLFSLRPSLSHFLCILQSRMKILSYLFSPPPHTHTLPVVSKYHNITFRQYKMWFLGATLHYKITVVDIDKEIYRTDGCSHGW